jgi:hypothetical protein
VRQQAMQYNALIEALCKRGGADARLRGEARSLLLEMAAEKSHCGGSVQPMVPSPPAFLAVVTATVRERERGGRWAHTGGGNALASNHRRCDRAMPLQL